MRVKSSEVRDREYQALAEFRYRLRQFLRFSQRAAMAAGLEPQQHQALLALRGLPAGQLPTVGRLAERMQLRHHSVVELVDRLAAKGLVRRTRDAEDRRRVQVRVTARGERVLRRLARDHHAELSAQGPRLAASLNQLLGPRSAGPRP